MLLMNMSKFDSVDFELLNVSNDSDDSDEWEDEEFEKDFYEDKIEDDGTLYGIDPDHQDFDFDEEDENDFDDEF